MHYNNLSNTPLENCNIRIQSLNEKIPLLRTNIEKDKKYIVKESNIFYNIINFFGFIFLFSSHIISVFHISHMTNAILDITGTLLLIVYSIKTNNMIFMIYMTLWFIVGVVQLAISHNIFRNNITYYESNNINNDTYITR